MLVLFLIMMTWDKNTWDVCTVHEIANNSAFLPVKTRHTKYLQCDSCVPAVIFVRTGAAVKETSTGTGENLASH